MRQVEDFVHFRDVSPPLLLGPRLSTGVSGGRAFAHNPSSSSSSSSS
eukprot:CAMPEP_0206526932 /NCGR_PEP_ID=MMETSP0325_2-20121206/1035_1 /ASSEMBLY_ACC=CAM_ASM_000347 /TAXON_ID=2866 /ORGANISM="Crypthecodinium cohnii, Strain Seligo" /LENGTH=46 /DNA_ID= /DNA_START= /DNA_END= /DNA_ORIENTATION=